MIVEAIANPAITFSLMAIFSLVFQFFEDLKKKEIDCKKNWIMTGVTLALFMVSKNTYWLLFLIIVFVIFKKQLLKIMADGDVEILQWLYAGMFLFGGINYVLFFLAVLFLSLAIWNVFVIKTNNHAEHQTQGTVFLLLAFSITAFARFFAV